jgi:hypothetical protein
MIWDEIVIRISQVKNSQHVWPPGHAEDIFNTILPALIRLTYRQLWPKSNNAEYGNTRKTKNDCSFAPF